MFIRERERRDWFAAACHKGGSSGGGGTTTTNTVQNADPWSGQQPYLTYGFEQAQNQYNSQNPSFYPGQTYATPSAETQTALNMQGNRAMMGSPLNQQAKDANSFILGGGFLNQGNPYLQNVTNSVAANVIPQVQGTFSGAGRYGGGAGQTEAMARGITNGISPYAFNDYSQARAMIPGAINAAPGLAATDYYDAQQLAQVGAAREGQTQQQINEDINRYNFGQNVDAMKLAQYMSMIQGNYGGTMNSTQTSQMPSNALMNYGGMGMMGLGALGSLFGSGGMFGSGGAFNFSDRRLKTDIERIGTTPAGIPVFAFRYLWSRARQIGVMAQDVLKVIPEAVSVHKSGFYMVDYARIA
jgi:hypothetical protein